MMMFAVAVLAAAAPFVSATPYKRASQNDVKVLNFALTLEHLEVAAYNGGLAKYDEAAFERAGFEPWVRGRMVEFAQHEVAHVNLLTQTLGSQATKPCTYKFPYTDPRSFMAFNALTLETGGVSAYLGAAHLIQDPNLLTVAGSILTTETRHQAWGSSAVFKKQPWSGPYDIPLDMNQVYSLVAGFIVSCPSSNPDLGVKAFPKLTGSPANAAPGTTVTYNFNSSGSSSNLYAVYYHGLNVTSVKLDSQRRAKVPSGFIGTYFTIITTGSNATDSNTVAGPLASMYDFPAGTNNLGYAS